MPQHSGHQPDDTLGWYMDGSATEVADILTEFAQELRRGDVNVWKGQRELHLAPGGKLRFEVRAEASDDGREQLRMILDWDASSAAMDLHGGSNEGVAENQTGALHDPNDA